MKTKPLLCALGVFVTMALVAMIEKYGPAEGAARTVSLIVSFAAMYLFFGWVTSDDSRKS